MGLSQNKIVQAKFVAQEVDLSTVETYLKKFKELKDKNKIKDTAQKDINFWVKEGFSKFKTFVDKTEKASSKTKKRAEAKLSGAELVTENSEWSVYRIKNFKACKLYAAGTKWCIANKNTWTNYYVNHDIYFLISKTRRKKDDNHKLAMLVDKKGRRSYWCAADYKIKSWGLTIPWFKALPPHLTWKRLGAPEVVNVSGMRLYSLEELGSPPKRVASLICRHNHLSNLMGAPKEVKRSFHCISNHLESLDGAPEIVGGGFFALTTFSRL